jgi:hypothetical protein
LTGSPANDRAVCRSSFRTTSWSRWARRRGSLWWTASSDFTRWKEHDAYTKALDRLLRDLRVGKA